MNNSASAPIPSDSSSDHLPWREKIAYGLGDAGFNCYWACLSAFLMIFYTDVFGLTAAAAGTVMSVVKMFSIFSPPMFGALSDRTQSRFGKFRPYMLWMALPLAGASVMTFTTPDLGPTGKLVYAYGTYFFMLLCYTGMNIPYNALSGVMTNLPQERTSINSLRFVFAFGGSALVTATTPFLVKWLGQGNEQLGWQLTMVVWAIAASLMFVSTFVNTRERVVSVKAKKSSVFQDLKDLIKNIPWLLLFLLALFTMVTVTLRTGAAAYYFKYYVQRPDVLAGFIPAYMISAAIGAAITPILTRVIDRRSLLLLLLASTGILSSLFYFVGKDQIWLMFALQIGIGFSLGPKAPLTFAMYADTADYNEWRTGRRATAMTFAAATFSQKVAIAVTGALMGWTLSVCNYTPNEEQTGLAQSGIVFLISFLPAIFAFLAFAAVWFYRLDDPTMAKVRDELAAQNSRTPQTSDSPAS